MSALQHKSDRIPDARRQIVRLLEETPSLIVLDEAYVDFADGSLVRMTDDWENLVV